MPQPFEGMSEMWDRGLSEESLGPIFRGACELCWSSPAIPSPSFIPSEEAS